MFLVISHNFVSIAQIGIPDFVQYYAIDSIVIASVLPLLSRFRLFPLTILFESRIIGYSEKLKRLLSIRLSLPYPAPQAGLRHTKKQSRRTA